MATLTIKKKDGSEVEIKAAPKKAIQQFTADELRAMLAELEPVSTVVQLDPTMDLPITPTDPRDFAAKANLPPPDERSAGAIQVAASVHGKFGLNGIPLLAPQVNLNEVVNPATGLPYVQVGPRPTTQISPPPTRNFR